MYRPNSLVRLVSTTNGLRNTVNPHSCLVKARATDVLPVPGGPSSKVWRDVTGTGSPILARAKFTLVVDLMSLISRLARSMPSIALSSASPSARYFAASSAWRAASVCARVGALSGSHGSVRASIVSGSVRISR